MRSIIRQAYGHEPEPVWMSVAGAAAVFLIPALVTLVAVALGWDGQ